MTQMMTIWSMSQSTGAALNTLLTNFYEERNFASFFVEKFVSSVLRAAPVDCDIDQIVIICVMNAFGAATAVIE